MKQSLAAASWTVEIGADAPAALAGRVIPARVPGSIHLDLVAAGLIEHPDKGDAELSEQWIGRSEFTWRTRFDLDPQMRSQPCIDLLFECLDTVAEITLNGARLGECRNEFLPHRFNATQLLRPAGNELAVRFKGPVREVERLEALLGARPVNGDWTPYPFLRKSACSFGWDWGPKVAGCGIRGEVLLHAWKGGRLESVRPLTLSCDANRAVLAVHVTALREAGAALDAEIELETPDRRSWSARVELEPRAAGRECVGSTTFEIDRPPRWWPRGHGSQPLCELRLRLTGSGASERWRRRIGLRSVRLDTAADDHGTRFALEINGRPIFCKGANWIPSSLFPHGETSAPFRRLLEQACDAHLNMLRVWGGGRYEPHAFYEICDELGLMVWQDFMFACATYPEDEPFPALVDAEARHHLARLSSHPSVVLWCGGNEDIQAWWSWGFRDRLAPGQGWGRRYWLEILPRAVAQLDPTRPYWVESPWSGSLELDPNDPDRGDRHTWDKRIEGYRDLTPRFVSEFGHQAPANHQTLVEAIGAAAMEALAAPPPTGVQEPPIEHRQRATGGSQMQYAILAEHFSAPRSWRDWHFQAQLLQARALTIGIEHLRVNRPRCMGAIFWQWNDVWSALSWSVIDVAGRCKPAWHAVRRAMAPRIVAIEPSPKGPCCHLVNDADAPWEGVLRIERRGVDGSVLATWSEPRSVDPGSAAIGVLVDEAVGTPKEPAREFIVATLDRQRTWWWYERDLRIAWPAPALSAHAPSAPALSARIRGGDDEWRLSLRAASVVRDLVIDVDGPWSSITPNVISLLPGEEVEVEVAAPGTAGGAPRLVFACANAARIIGVQVQKG